MDRPSDCLRLRRWWSSVRLCVVVVGGGGLGTGSLKGLSPLERPVPATRGAGRADMWLSVLGSLNGCTFGTLSLLSLPRPCCPWASWLRSSSSIRINVRKSGWYWSLAFLSLVFSVSEYLSRTTSSLCRFPVCIWDVIRDHQFKMLAFTDSVPFISLAPSNEGFRPCVLSSP